MKTERIGVFLRAVSPIGNVRASAFQLSQLGVSIHKNLSTVSTSFPVFRNFPTVVSSLQLPFFLSDTAPLRLLFPFDC